MHIFHVRALVARSWRPLSSNVKPHRRYLMTLQHLLASMFACSIVLLSGCATTDRNDGRLTQRPRIEAPQQAAGSLRLVIYRPQTIVGMLGRPIVVINGHQMLNAVRESMLDPGSVFIVDAPADHANVDWIQHRRNELSADSIVFKDLRGATRYLRWTLKPTYGYLEQVEEDAARQELGPLRYTGYRNLAKAE